MSHDQLQQIVSNYCYHYCYDLLYLISYDDKIDDKFIISGYTLNGINFTNYTGLINNIEFTKKLFIDILNWSDKFWNKDGCQWSI